MTDQEQIQTKDAERYRKLRDLATGQMPGSLEAFVACNALDYCSPGQFDDIVDSLPRKL
jgi:hypothetical protein